MCLYAMSVLINLIPVTLDDLDIDSLHADIVFSLELV